MFFKNLNYTFFGLFLQTALGHEKGTKSPDNLSDFCIYSLEQKNQAVIHFFQHFSKIGKFLSEDVLQKKPEVRENSVAFLEDGIEIKQETIVDAIVFYSDFGNFLEKFFVYLDKISDHEVFFFELKTSLGEQKLLIIESENIQNHTYFQILKKCNSNFENLILGEPIIISWEEEIIDPKKNKKQNVTYMFELKKKAYLREYMFSEEEKNNLRNLIEKKRKLVGKKKVVLARILCLVLVLNNLFEKNETKTLGNMSVYSFVINNRVITDDDICFRSFANNIQNIKYMLKIFEDQQESLQP